MESQYLHEEETLSKWGKFNSASKVAQEKKILKKLVEGNQIVNLSVPFTSAHSAAMSSADLR